MNHQYFLSRLAGGDRAVFAELVEQTKDLVYNTALGIVQHEQDAEDITQDVFVTVYEKIGEFKGESTITTWLYKITLRKSFDFEKKKRRQSGKGFLKQFFVVKQNAEEHEFNHPGVLLDNKENASVLFAAIRKLPAQQRIAFTLHKLEQLGNKEIADVMGLSVTAVESIQARAKRNLRKYLHEYYKDY